MPAERCIFSAPSVCPKRSESREANYPLSHHHFHRPNDNMGLRDGLQNLLSLPRKGRRAQSEVRSEADLTPDPGEIGPVVPRPTESSPDLRIGPPTSPTFGPSTSRDQESNGMSTALFRVIHLTTSPRDADRPADFGQIRSVLESGQGERPTCSYHETTDSSGVHENKSSSKSTTYSTTELAISLVKESSDACLPLKSVAGSLSAILQHCDVLSISSISHRP